MAFLGQLIEPLLPKPSQLVLRERRPAYHLGEQLESVGQPVGRRVEPHDEGVPAHLAADVGAQPFDGGGQLGARATFRAFTQPASGEQAGPGRGGVLDCAAGRCHQPHRRHGPARELTRHQPQARVEGAHLGGRESPWPRRSRSRAPDVGPAHAWSLFGM